MKLLLVLLCFHLSYPQEGFTFLAGRKKVSIPFELVSNLVIIPMKINGVELHFLLDTGVEETVLFSLDQKEELQLYNVEKIQLRGLGNQNAVEGLKSTNNILSFQELEKKKQEVLVVMDQEMNFSSSLGVAVNGIIGAQFFKGNVVKIDYEAKKVIVYNESKTSVDKLTKGYKAFDITVEKNKPYIIASIVLGSQELDVKLLLDTGNSDAVWLFNNKSVSLPLPEKNFEDFLGKGFSGEIYGSRAVMEKFSLGSFTFKKTLVAFPDTLSLRHVKMVNNRLGSMGGEIFHRFDVMFDYKNAKMYLRSNGNFPKPFSYNRSGLEVHHVGLKWVKDFNVKDKKPIREGIVINFGSTVQDLQYKFELKPVYEIVSVRKGSPAEQCGLQKGDIIFLINGFNSYNYTLDRINELLKSSGGRVIDIQVERNGVILKYKLQLKDLL